MKFTKNIFFIESHNFNGLWLLNTEPTNVYKLYWLSKGPYKNSNIHLKLPLYYFRSLLANIIINPDFVSMFHHQISQLDFIWVGKRKRFAFTINSKEEYKQLYDKKVSVILTDNLKAN